MNIRNGLVVSFSNLGDRGGECCIIYPNIWKDYWTIYWLTNPSVIGIMSDVSINTGIIMSTIFCDE